MSDNKDKSSFNEDGLIDLGLPDVLNLWEKPAPKNEQPIAADNKPSDKAALTPKQGEPNGKEDSDNRGASEEVHTG